MRQNSEDILAEDTVRYSGRGAQRNNILAARIVAETVRSTLGPRGMDKLLIDSAGEMIITNDGVTILNEMHIEHPAAKMVVEVARSQEDEVGDGTTSAVILAGEFLKNAETLLDEKIHPTVIIRGFRLAQEHALTFLENIAIPIGSEHEQELLSIAETAMTGKGAEAEKTLLARLAVDAALNTFQGTSGDKESVRIFSAPGGAIKDSSLINGLILERERVHPHMPPSVSQASILLLDSPLELKETGQDARLSISSPEQLQTFLDQEERSLKKIAESIIATGATAVFCQKGIDDIIGHHLAQNGIFAVRRVKKSDMERLAQATGAKILSSTSSISSNDLGSAGEVEQDSLGKEQHVFVRDCSQKKIVTLLLRGGTPHVVAELERALTDALGDLRAAFKYSKAVGGGGATEMRVRKSLGLFADSITGREQLAAHAYAKSFEIILRTLSENCGYDAIQVLTEATGNEKELLWPGLDAMSGHIIDTWKAGIIEPLQIKVQAINAATDVACMILRIDDVIAAGPMERSPSIEDR